MSDKSRDPVKVSGSNISESTENSSSGEIDAFLNKVKEISPASTSAGKGRLLFAMDATMSRQATWDMALQQQSEMFHTVTNIGGLSVQLVYFRGYNECRASKWVNNPDALARLMRKVHCEGGYTQIGRVLVHALNETQEKKVGALVYVGDAVEEDIDDLSAKAGELALYGLPVFIFQEGHNHRAEKAFREIARITKGAYCRFDAGSADQLKELLTAVAAYAAGGVSALEDMSSSGKGQLLLEQLKK